MELSTLHLGILLVTSTVILYADHLGYQYVRGIREYLPYATLRFLHTAVWTGLLLMILSGFFLLLPQWEYVLQEPAFFVKLGFIGVLVLNAFSVGKLTHTASSVSFANLPNDTRKTLFISGVLSCTGWIGAALIGLYFL